jgi:hypothetical protein
MKTSLLSLAALILLGSSSASACRCLPPPEVKVALGKSAAVFSGKVTSIERGQRTMNVTFEISQSWKGTKGKSVTVTTALSSAACGYGFKKGKSYLVYCIKSRGKVKAAKAFRTGICSRTKTLAQAKADLKKLGKGTKP